MLFNKEENPIVQEWKERYSKQTPEIQRRLDELKHKDKMTEELIPIKRTRVTPKAGDIFVVQAKEGIYFHGKVLNSNIKHLKSSHMINGCHTVCIFNSKTKDISLPDKELSYDNLLIKPMIVDMRCWTMGYFYTIGNKPLTYKEQNLEYGFYNIAFGKYLKENGEELSSRPKYLGTYGMASYGTIAYEMTKEFVINCNILNG